MKKISILMFAIVALTMACEDNAETDNVKIRIANNSAFDFKNVIVNTSTGNMEFGNIPAGQHSEYKSFTKAYRYAFIQVEVENDTLSIQPTDYVGESPLKNGRYAYQISLNGAEENKSISLTLLKDK